MSFTLCVYVKDSTDANTNSIVDSTPIPGVNDVKLL